MILIFMFVQLFNVEVWKAEAGSMENLPTQTHSFVVRSSITVLWQFHTHNLW